MKVLFFIPSLKGGGAERVVSRMATFWACKGWVITIGTFHSVDTDAYELPTSISRFQIKTDHKKGLVARVYSYFLTLWKLRIAQKSLIPDVIISFIDVMNIKILLSSILLHTPIIISERINPRYKKRHWLHNLHERILYRTANMVVVQTEHIQNVMRSYAPNSCVIPNPITRPSSSIHEQANIRNKSTKILCSVGRLYSQKQHHLLVEAFSKIAATFPTWNLVIIGEGILRPDLENLIHSYNMVHRIKLPGFIKDIESFLLQSDIYVSASLYEGFSNALVEAMFVGLPTISFDYPGVRDAINDQYDGILVPMNDIERMSQAMSLLMSNDSERKRLGQNAQKNAEIFSIEKVMAMWEKLIFNLTSNSKTTN